MGIAVDQDSFSEEQFAHFEARLADNLVALEKLLARPGFGSGEASIGAELEFFVTGADGDPLMVSRRLLDELPGETWTPELDRFNIECNSRPHPLRGNPFGKLEQELGSALADLRRVAARHGARAAIIGILPTLEPHHLTSSSITNLPRYRAMNAGLRRLRHEPFHVRIHGLDDLQLDAQDVSYEGANTSLQVHLRVAPDDFADLHNAAQLATSLAVAISGNAPTFLGKRLWEETRIALFKQAVDDRDTLSVERGRLPRVCFGVDWLRDGVLELFTENVRHHAPIVAACDTEDPLAAVEAGETPTLGELRLHSGTIWRWNRPVYDPACGGHLRIEFRALPAGPTVTDMVANAAFLVGLTLALRADVSRLIQAMPFAAAHANFYRAARDGLNAELTWPDDHGQLASMKARDLVAALLPRAREGLEAGGVARAEAEYYVDVVRARLRAGQTGAQWQRACLRALGGDGPPQRAALHGMLDRYMELSETGAPVHTWPVPRAAAAGGEHPRGQPVVRSTHPPLARIGRPASMPDDPVAFARQLGGPTWIDIPGQDRSRTRLVATLLHGNEPSGLRAMHRYLLSGARPAVDTVLYIAQIDAALAAPGFSFRMLPGRRDMNRVFAPPYDQDIEGARALAFIEAFSSQSFEALVDLHNNTGRNPTYTVAFGVDDARLNLADLFGNVYMNSDIRLHTLVEFTARACPSITVECGAAGDPVADASALAGLERFLSAGDLGLGGPPPARMEVLANPVRVHVRGEIDIAFRVDTAWPAAHLTLRPDLDSFNFQPLAARTPIGRVRQGVGWPLDARGADGIDVSRELFEQVGDELRTRVAMVPVMMTADPVVAKADCLFYAMNVGAQ